MLGQSDLFILNKKNSGESVPLSALPEPGMRSQGKVQPEGSSSSWRARRVLGVRGGIAGDHKSMKGTGSGLRWNQILIFLPPLEL